MKTAAAHALLLFLGAAAFARADNPDPLRRTGNAFTRVAREAIPAVVFIRVEKDIVAAGPAAPDLNDPFGFFGDDFMRRFFGRGGPYYRPRRYRQEGQGTGFLISKDGFILTNSHVVGDADRISVRLSDGREFEAKRVGADPKSEVAVIRIEGDNLPCVRLGDSSTLEIGEWVIAIGNPFGLRETLTVGVVSAKGRSNIGVADYEDFIQTDAAINPGNSGGPLLNIDGEVVGINTAIYSQSGGYMGIGFAIPINMARAIKDQLVATGRVQRGYIGVHVQDLTPELARSFGTTEKTAGLLIADVVDGSPAAQAGMKAGDIVLEINGAAPGSVGDFQSNVTAQPPGTDLRLRVLRDGREREVRLKTGFAPGEEPAEEHAADALADRLGVLLLDLDEQTAARLGYEPGDGVLVAGVQPGSPGWRADMRPGNLVTAVNRQTVASLDEFRRAVAAQPKDRVLLLRVRSGEFSRYIVVQPE